MARSIRLGVLVALVVPLLGQAQEVRFELGQRLRLFERALDRHPGPECRKRALEPLEQATPTFFKGQLAAAAGLLDRARLLLQAEKPTDEQLWAESLVVRPGRRYLDPAAKELGVKVESFYKVKAAQPEKARVRLSIVVADKASTAVLTAQVKDLPLNLTLPVKDVVEGDHTLRAEVLIDDKPIAVSEQTVSLSANLAARLAKLKKGHDSLDEKKRAFEKATLGRLLDLLRDLQSGRTQETNYPAHRLLVEAEGLLAAAKADTPYFGPDRAGQFWLTLVTGAASDPVRVQIPEEAKKGKPLPVVVALHGAGGSENMFFDGYGDGLVAKLCARRGWILVTTRTPLLALGGGPDVARVVDALGKLYPVDAKKVFLIGHSMGAAQAVATAGRKPDRFVAVAALGGGGALKLSEEVKGVRFFVGCGDRDFALSGAKNLHRLLVKEGVKKVTFKTYEDVEHLSVVQLALPEVFQFFDEALER